MPFDPNMSFERVAPRMGGEEGNTPGGYLWGDGSMHTFTPKGPESGGLGEVDDFGNPMDDMSWWGYSGGKNWEEASQGEQDAFWSHNNTQRQARYQPRMKSDFGMLTSDPFFMAAAALAGYYGGGMPSFNDPSAMFASAEGGTALGSSAGSFAGADLAGPLASETTRNAFLSQIPQAVPGTMLEVGGSMFDIGAPISASPLSAMSSTFAGGPESFASPSMEASRFFNPSFGPNNPVGPGASFNSAAAPGGGMFSGGGQFDPMEILKRLMKGGKQSTAGSLFDVGQGLYGMYQGNQQQKIAEKAAAMADPFASQRPYYQGEMSALQRDPSRIFTMPGYKAGEQAVNRGMAAGGYLGSGKQMAALQQYGGNFYNQEMQRLMQMSGANFGPGNSGAILAQGGTNAASLYGNALNRVGYGLSGLWGN